MILTNFIRLNDKMFEIFLNFVTINMATGELFEAERSKVFARPLEPDPGNAGVGRWCKVYCPVPS